MDTPWPLFGIKYTRLAEDSRLTNVILCLDVILNEAAVRFRRRIEMKSERFAQGLTYLTPPKRHEV